MFKRRDWVHMHGQQGEGSSDDDSSEDSEQEDSSSSSAVSDDSSAQGSDAQSSDLEQDEGPSGPKRLQDLSEDDFDEHEAEELKRLRVDVDELVQWCPGTLLLNAVSLKTHMDSKRHQKRQKMCAEDPNPICLAEDIQGDDTEEAETHAERLQRLRKIAAPADLSGLSVSQKRKIMRKLKAEQRKKALLHRPGKRQRAQLKAEVFSTAGSEATGKNKPQEKAQKADTRGKQNKQHQAQKAGIKKNVKTSKA